MQAGSKSRQTRRSQKPIFETCSVLTNSGGLVLLKVGQKILEDLIYRTVSINMNQFLLVFVEFVDCRLAIPVDLQSAFYNCFFIIASMKQWNMTFVAKAIMCGWIEQNVIGFLTT